VWLIKVLKHTIFIVQFRPSQISLNKEASMDNKDWIDNVDEKMKASNEDRQRLILRVNFFSSTITFTLNTFIQYQVFIGQLQDEVKASFSSNSDNTEE
jgi:hypothetical protein